MLVGVGLASSPGWETPGSSLARTTGKVSRASWHRRPRPILHFIYVDLSERARSWKRGQRGVRLYYLLWQKAALRRARELHGEERFDLVWHLTLANIWMGSLAGLSWPAVCLRPGGWRNATTLRRAPPAGCVEPCIEILARVRSPAATQTPWPGTLGVRLGSSSYRTRRQRLAAEETSTQGRHLPQCPPPTNEPVALQERPPEPSSHGTVRRPTSPAQGNRDRDPCDRDDGSMVPCRSGQRL